MYQIRYKLKLFLRKMKFESFLVCLFKGTNKGSKFIELEFSVSSLMARPYRVNILV